jgi:hypothetical protein
MKLILNKIYSFFTPRQFVILVWFLICWSVTTISLVSHSMNQRLRDMVVFLDLQLDYIEQEISSSTNRLSSGEPDILLKIASSGAAKVLRGQFPPNTTFPTIQLDQDLRSETRSQFVNIGGITYLIKRQDYSRVAVYTVKEQLVEQNLIKMFPSQKIMYTNSEADYLYQWPAKPVQMSLRFNHVVQQALTTDRDINYFRTEDSSGQTVLVVFREIDAIAGSLLISQVGTDAMEADLEFYRRLLLGFNLVFVAGYVFLNKWSVFGLRRI